MIRNRSFLSLLVVLLSSPAWAVIPGGVYRNDNSISLMLDPQALPRTQGYHVVRGSAVYHGRKINFYSGVFLPPAFFHTSEAMPVVMGLHNRYAIGQNPDAMLGEGMGQILAYGGPDTRAQGDTPAHPMSLRKDAQFIGLVPLCPAGFNWEDPAMADLLGKFIDQIVANYHADGDRVYLTGFSYGASSTWRVALNAPTRFAAIICCDGRATPDPIHDVEKLKEVAVYLEVGQWDGEFVGENDRMHQALAALPHPNFIFHQIPGGNHFNYQAVYNDPEVWKWVFAQHRKHPMATTRPEQFTGSAEAK